MGDIVGSSNDHVDSSASAEARAHLAAIVDSSNDGIISKTLDGVILSWNAAAERIFGYSAEEAVGKPILMLLPPERQDEEAMILSRIRKGERIGHFETVRVRKDGSLVEISVTISPIRDENGKIIGASKIARDISNLKATERALISSEQRFSQFMRHLPGLAWIKDLQGRYVFANDAALKAFNVERSELEGKTDDDLFEPATARAFRQNDETALKHKTGVLTLETLQQPDGVTHTSIVSKFPIVDPQGMPSFVAGMAIDITERIQAENQLRESEARFRELANSMPAIVWMSGRDGGPIFLNRWYYEYTGLSPDSPGNDGWALVVHPEDRPHAFQNWKASNESGTAWEEELRLLRADGEFRWFLSRCVPIMGEDGTIQQWLGTSVDVHDRKTASDLLEERVNERTAELAAANEEMEGFTYSVSHDLRAPLRNIVATCRMLQEDFGESLPPAAVEHLESQANSANRLGALIDELLKLSRIGRSEMKLQAVDLSQAARDVAAELHYPGITFDVKDGLSAVGDPSLLKLVLANLIDNACKFSPHGGTVSIGRQGEAFFVRDEGIGFDMRFAHKLFLPFERLVTDNEFPGTGIGLANVNRIIQRHSGRIWVESCLGKGTTFFFTLASERAGAEGVQSADAQSVP